MYRIIRNSRCGNVRIFFGGRILSTAEISLRTSFDQMRARFENATPRESLLVLVKTRINVWTGRRRAGAISMARINAGVARPPEQTARRRENVDGTTRMVETRNDEFCSGGCRTRDVYVWRRVLHLISRVPVTSSRATAALSLLHPFRSRVTGLVPRSPREKRFVLPLKK